MKRTTPYEDVRFSAATIQRGVETFRSLHPDVEFRLDSYVVHSDNTEWSYRSLEEFLAEYQRFSGQAYLALISMSEPIIMINVSSRNTRISISSDDRSKIQSSFLEFDNEVEASRLAPLFHESEERNTKVFIGHGQSSDWRDLKDHLQDKHGIEIVSYETGSRAGHTIRDILEDMLDETSFAVLVFTGEDEQKGGGVRARQNVVHEAGLFQGRMGFSRAIIVKEEGVEVLSNLDGVQYIEYKPGNIRSTFGDVVATIRREITE